MSSSKSTLPRPPSSTESSKSSKTSDSSSLSGLNLDNILGPLSCTALLSLPVTALLHKGDQGTNHHDTRLRSGWTPHGTENLWQYARTRQLPTASWKTHEHIPSAEEVFTASSCLGHNPGYVSQLLCSSRSHTQYVSLLISHHTPHRKKKKSLACETKLSVKVLSHQNAISLGQPNSTHSLLEVKLKRLQLLQ